MKRPGVILLLLFMSVFSPWLHASKPGDDPVSLVISTTGSIFAEVEKNLEKYEAEQGSDQGRQTGH